MEPLWTADDVARELGCERWQVYRLVKRGLPTLRLGPKLLRFDRAQVRAWAERQGQERRTAG